jgi:hypothetical protein
MLLIRKSLEQEMLDDFLLEESECKKILSITGSKANKDYAHARLLVLESSILELQKQIKHPERHSMLLQGINPNEA